MRSSTDAVWPMTDPRESIGDDRIGIGTRKGNKKDHTFVVERIASLITPSTITLASFKMAAFPVNPWLAFFFDQATHERDRNWSASATLEALEGNHDFHDGINHWLDQIHGRSVILLIPTTRGKVSSYDPQHDPADRRGHPRLGRVGRIQNKRPLEDLPCGDSCCRIGRSDCH
jgi:hypothetical protein